MQTEQTMDAIGAAISTKTAYTGAGVSGIGWVFSSEFGVMAGVIIGVLGLLTNLYFRRKQDRREQHEYEARMRAMGLEP
jgi:hypothetical protein